MKQTRGLTMNTNLFIRGAQGLMVILLATTAAHARDGVLTLQGRILSPSCNAMAISTAMSHQQRTVNGQNCGLAVGTSDASTMSVANVRVEIVSEGTNDTSVKRMVTLTYN
jgi:type 1 fimbria pilin